ncbi:metallophosphoesterase family protein [Belliella sp. DSM 107340]|uniref:Metallophosphoesterase family protein n=1 Tax=Belliella calami TaxID=2923436 RepID=A0ABS9UN71_9BACT|nr:metallophosphoesterase family protein [Belliella calami]MCH7398037.1 metallophosphoesterase family protein [Belliella calami]
MFKEIFIKSAIFTYVVFFYSLSFSQSLEKNTPTENPQIPFKASAIPDRLIMGFGENPYSERVFTWRTITAEATQELQIAQNDGSVDFYKDPDIFNAKSVLFVSLQKDSARYHSVKIENLIPNSSYSYRVGSGDNWSSWIDFDTNILEESFKFIYLGDAQSDLYSLWSRVVQSASKKAPDAKFVMHVGDLINHSQNDYEWAEWFWAGSSMINSVPQIIVPGNHEYVKNEKGEKIGISPLWNPHFNFPQNGPKELANTAYSVDYGNCRFIMLNSNEQIENQVSWLEGKLKDNPHTWTVVMFHHPVISAAEGRINEGVLRNWKPLLDKYKVDLVLQGHDHVYARGNKVDSELNEWDEASGTVYVVSVAGRKMYPISNHPWMQKKAQNLQTFQVISVETNKIVFESFKTDGSLFDKFEIKKTSSGINELIENLNY